MILNDLIRTLIGYLSAWYPNKNYQKKIIQEMNHKKNKKNKITKKNLCKTHVNLIILLLKSKDIKNF